MTYEETVRIEYEALDFTNIKTYMNLNSLPGGILLAQESGLYHRTEDSVFTSERPSQHNRPLATDPATFGVLSSLVSNELLFDFYGNLSLWCNPMDPMASLYQRCLILYQFLQMTDDKIKPLVDNIENG